MKNDLFISKDEALEALWSCLNYYHAKPAGYYDALCTSLHVRNVLKGEIVIAEGQLCDNIFFVAQGFCFGYYAWEGKEYIMNFFRQGEFAIIFHSFWGRQESFLNLKASENTTLGLIPHKDFMELLKDPDFKDMIFRMQTNLLIREEHIQRIFRCYTAEERIRFFFKSREIQLLMQHIPQYRIASWLNMAPETFAKIWGQLNLP